MPRKYTNRYKQLPVKPREVLIRKGTRVKLSRIGQAGSCDTPLKHEVLSYDIPFWDDEYMFVNKGEWRIQVRRGDCETKYIPMDKDPRLS